MRTITLHSIFALLVTASALSDDYSSFLETFSDISERSVEKRASCPLNYNACANLGHSELCCPYNNNCQLDAANNVACCPFNALCTGTIGLTAISATASTRTTISGSSGTPPSTITSVSGVAGGNSVVNNQYFPFVYLPTSFPNSGVCSSYWQSCQMESASCFSLLSAGGNGVTIAAPAITVVAPSVTAFGSSSASSICSSLSQAACYGIPESSCAMFGGGGAATATSTAPSSGVSVVTVVINGPAARATLRPEMLYAVGAGAMAGAAGMLMR